MSEQSVVAALLLVVACVTLAAGGLHCARYYHAQQQRVTCSGGLKQIGLSLAPLNDPSALPVSTQ